MRYDQRIQECESLLQSFHSESSPRSPEDQSEIQLLQASLCRFFGKMEESERALNEINIQAVNFKRFHLQKAFNYFILGNYIKASIHFKKVLTDKSVDYESYLAQMNLIFCMDNMGLDTSIYLDGLQEMAQKVSAPSSLNHDQILSLKIRNQFKQGLSLSELFKVRSQKPTQSIYIKLWISSLPYMNSKGEGFSFDYEFSQLLDVDLLFKEYRIGTLLGKDCSADVSKDVKISELIDRLYLWTWFWLDEKLPISLLENTILQIKEHPQISTLSAEDTLLLKNALGWIELFTCRMDLFRQLPIPPMQGRFSVPLYARENELIQMLLSTKDVGGLKLDESFVSEKLKAKIQAHFATPETLDSNQVVVHLKTGKIVSESSSICLEAARFMHLTQSSHSVSFENVLFYCFGIKTYDPSVHYPKITNLVQRLKKNYSEIYEEISVNNNNVHLKMREKNFRFILDSEINLSKLSESSPKIELLNLGSKTSGALISLFRKHPEKKYTQLELTIILDQSKATVVRALNKEIEKGSIVKMGQGKNTFYQLKEDL